MLKVLVRVLMALNNFKFRLERLLPFSLSPIFYSPFCILMHAITVQTLILSFFMCWDCGKSFGLDFG